MRRTLPLRLVIAATVGLLAVTGCSPDGATPGAETTAGPASVPLADGQSVPTFTGPWATEYENAYRGSTSDLQREILEDGVITDQEITAVQDDFTSCMTARGFTNISFDAAGGFSVKQPDGYDDSRVHGVVNACQDATLGSVIQLAMDSARKPGNEDEAEVMATCLATQGEVEKSYTAEDYVREMEAGTPSFNTSSTGFRNCVMDPFGAGAVPPDGDG